MKNYKCFFFRYSVSFNLSLKPCFFFQNLSIPCSCVDCPIACPFTRLEIDEDNTFMIGKFNGYGIIAAICVVVFTIVASFIYGLLLYINRSRKGKTVFSRNRFSINIRFSSKFYLIFELSIIAYLLF